MGTNPVKPSRRPGVEDLTVNRRPQVHRRPEWKLCPFHSLLACLCFPITRLEAALKAGTRSYSSLWTSIPSKHPPWHSVYRRCCKHIINVKSDEHNVTLVYILLSFMGGMFCVFVGRMSLFNLPLWPSITLLRGLSEVIQNLEECLALGKCSASVNYP